MFAVAAQKRLRRRNAAVRGAPDARVSRKLADFLTAVILDKAIIKPYTVNAYLALNGNIRSNARTESRRSVQGGARRGRTRPRATALRGVNRR